MPLCSECESALKARLAGWRPVIWACLQHQFNLFREHSKKNPTNHKDQRAGAKVSKLGYAYSNLHA